jgi:glycosyltransferase involved in cell wall biosynthesis
VIASSTSSLPEVVGDAALQVDPLSVSQLAEAMARLVEDRALHQRLRSAGFAQAARFSWQNCVRDTLRVYDTVMSAPQKAI